jgi:membrane associated rhomboid family serine protease
MLMRRRPYVVYFFLLLNVFVFLLWASATQSRQLDFMAENFLVSWTALQEHRPWVLITAAFSHNLVWHLLLNMLVLNSFGPLMELQLGSRRFFIFYMVAAVLSSLSHALLSNYVLHAPDMPALGASGALSGVIMLFALMFPRQILLLFYIIPLPAIFGALAFVALDLWGLSAQAHGGGLPIGHGAHLGGALTGAIFYVLFWRRPLRNRVF